MFFHVGTCKNKSSLTLPANSLFGRVSTKYEKEHNHRKNSLVSRRRHKRKPENEARIRKTEEPSNEEKRTESQ